MVFIFKTHPFNMTFEEIKGMTFRQAVLMIKELNSQSKQRQKQVKSALDRNKGVMGVYDIATGIF